MLFVVLCGPQNVDNYQGQVKSCSLTPRVARSPLLAAPCAAPHGLRQDDSIQLLLAHARTTAGEQGTTDGVDD